MNKLAPTLLTSAIAGMPLAAAHAATATPVHKPVATPTAATKHVSTAKPAPTRTIAGPVENMQWGAVQVTLIVKGKRITDVRATAPMERARSAFINGQVLPILRSEVLKAQSANIDGISGATMTSYAYWNSLKGALAKIS